tara:strand:+ start:373 stop:999 length:627 start_codon:yes stop_codon:yes gene_type:complete
MYEILNVPNELKGELKTIATSDDAEWLLAQLSDALAITTHHVIKVAALVRRLDECGVEIEIDFTLIPLLRKVAYGQVLPELIVTLQGAESLLRKAAALSISDQTKIAHNVPLTVMQTGGEHRNVPPLSMTSREIRQVFANGKLRSDAEQIGWLSDEREKHQAAKGTSDVVLDRKRGGITVNGTFIAASDMARYLGELTSVRRKTPVKV